jgi:two-component system phosphate regulon response regulator OmpR
MTSGQGGRLSLALRNIEELAARGQFARAEPLARQIELRFGDRTVDLATRELLGAQGALPITSGEFALLAALVRHPHRPLSRERLIELARGPTSETESHSMDVQISRLRKLIEPDPARPRYVQTVWGYGYVFVPDGQPRQR